MHRYWFEFEYGPVEAPIGASRGCSVTAASEDAARKMLQLQVFDGPLPPDRPPSYKPNLELLTANFEQRWNPQGAWQSNGHLEILDP